MIPQDRELPAKVKVGKGLQSCVVLTLKVSETGT